jgi:cytidylate kinase
MYKLDSEERTVLSMNTIITIGRQFGSGGHEIGERLADYFGIKCYDKELLSRVAKESGFCQEMIETHDERPTNSFLYNLVMDTYSFGYNSSSFMDMPISHKVFLAQFDTIKKLADEEPCIIVGRCADYALSEYKNCLNLFIYGNEETKVKRIMKKYELTEQKAKEMMTKKDKQRQSYYNYYSSKKWGRADSYDLCINSSRFGIDGTVKLIVQAVEDIENQQKQ